jgi:hypothetical protein
VTCPFGERSLNQREIINILIYEFGALGCNLAHHDNSILQSQEAALPWGLRNRKGKAYSLRHGDH